MLEIEKWAQDKSFFIGLFATNTAAFARDMHEAMGHIKERRVYNFQFPLPHLPSWFKMYCSHSKSEIAFVELVSRFSDFGKDALSLVGGFHALQETLEQNPDKKIEFSQTEVENAQQVLRDMHSKSFKGLQEDFSGVPFDQETNADFLRFTEENELAISFFLLVMCPCFLFFQMSPTRLYRNARRGDIAAIEKLLSIDPLLLHDPSIGKQIQDLRFNNKSTSYERLLETARKPFKPKKLSRHKMKVFQAGLISFMANGIKQPLTEPQIRALFDAVAQDAQGKQIDTDLPDSPESFAKAIQRKREPWQKLLDPDKKK
ncbi:hypothetical protein [Geobacter sp. AOG1]|uniref:hypothetical protein n=1 Tax=Geobacter sp. AOG1 TaxID=1566346 RepID=UPI001CC53F80|nr:hypothetical protein [Geobacter sp. AOG1]GFE58739.1 hypothetical protein AOG1_26190 [Geobacter sp. AOG1]